VDDGKSTLIGRLLYESQALYEDQVRSVASASRHRGNGPIDFSLFTDGLKAEREQGITIDVAYRYFATARRKFVLADTPGHEQYTRNMATGASLADVAILLVDARQGPRDQSRRHARIARLMGVRDFIVATNKMDLVAYDRRVFESIEAGFGDVLAGARVQSIPISALHGDNVTAKSARMPWYDGPTLLDCLESIPAAGQFGSLPFRYPVQLVVRTPDFRGYAGRILSGTARVGDHVTAWPAGIGTTISRIVTRDGDLELARAPASVVLALADELDLGRGDVLAAEPPRVASGLVADVVWMDERPLDPARRYRLKHVTRTVGVHADRAVQLNEIARVNLTTSRPLVFDTYDANRRTGHFVLIDPDSGFTAAAAMIAGATDSPSLATTEWRSVAERLAAIARRAPTDVAAAGAVQRILEEMLDD
jgi:sulfate adenylyltransferase large subunit